MSDAHSRGLERRWRATGDPNDGLAWLGVCLRSGLVSPERLRLAVHLGDPLALAFAGLDSFPLPLSPFVRRLEGWGKEACVRAALAAARPVVSRLSGVPSLLLARAVRSGDRWLTAARPRGLGPRGGAHVTRRTLAQNLEAAISARGPFTAALQASLVAEKAEGWFGLPGASAVREAIRAEVAPWALACAGCEVDRLSA